MRLRPSRRRLTTPNQSRNRKARDRVDHKGKVRAAIVRLVHKGKAAVAGRKVAVVTEAATVADMVALMGANGADRVADTVGNVVKAADVPAAGHSMDRQLTSNSRS